MPMHEQHIIDDIIRRAEQQNPAPKKTDPISALLGLSMVVVWTWAAIKVIVS